MQSTPRMRAWTSPDFRRRLSVAERSCTTTERLSERPAPDASFPAVNFNGQRFVPSATERRIASCCIGLPVKQIALNVTAVVLTLRGLVTYYVYFSSIESRRVDIAGITVRQRKRLFRRQ
jgi:hypothetical protein